MPASRRLDMPVAMEMGLDHDDRRLEWGDITVDFVTPPDGDLAPLLKGLPDDRCQCPHWGFLFRGRVVVRYADHEETIEAGQAFYMPPGHVPESIGDCELLQYSPTNELRKLEEVMARNMAALQGAR